ncbi:MAG: transketolase, partial [Bacteroidia bacterium]|nr:transketolase [Bacteroidia bacterium]
GQLDIVTTLHFPYNSLSANFASFGWKVIEVDATKYHTVYNALLEFKYGERDGRPTVIICKTTKGHGGLSDYMNTHKATISKDILDQEDKMQLLQRAAREKDFFRFFNELSGEDFTEVRNTILKHAAIMNFKIEKDKVVSVEIPVKTKKAPVRDKKIKYNPAQLPKLEKGKPYGVNKVIELSMKAFAQDERVFSIDSDLASTSGLQAGIGFVDKYRALNAGVAEANMMLLGEAFAILGGNAWVSTFCPFFDWKVMRRIAVGYQERLEVIAEKNGWLSEGHGLDLTMVATAADLETQSNGATHMGNDDVMLFNEVAQLKIINVSCPQQLLSVLKWIMEGDRGMIYMRVLRAPGNVIYDADFTFEFGKAYKVKHSDEAEATIVTSGRCVYEALDAAKKLEEEGILINVFDMPTIDELAIGELYQSGKPVFIAEQNNGYLWYHFKRVLFEKETSINTQKLIPVNTSTKGGLHYIHSGTYKELAAHYGLDGEHISELVLKTLKTKKAKADTI